jgi:hypothetical protein
MGGGFCESPFMALSTVTINGEKFYFNFVVDTTSTFEFIIDQNLPVDFNIMQTYYATGMHINQNSTFDFNIDQLKNSDFLR